MAKKFNPDEWVCIDTDRYDNSDKSWTKEKAKIELKYKEIAKEVHISKIDLDKNTIQYIVYIK